MTIEPERPNLNDPELRIGMLRQWLNEDRVTDPKKMVTNEDLHHWLDPGIPTMEALLKEVREAVGEDDLAMYTDDTMWGDTYFRHEDVIYGRNDHKAEMLTKLDTIASKYKLGGE